MTNILVVVLTLAYILVAYIGPVATFVFSGYWAWTIWSSEEGGLAAAIAVFILNAIVLLLVLSFAKRMLKKLMNMVELEEDEDLEAAKD